MSITNRYKTLVEKNKVSKSKAKSIYRWLERLIGYEYAITHKIGKKELIALKKQINWYLENT